MSFNLLNRLNVINSKTLLGVVFCVITFLSFASVQDDFKTYKTASSDSEATAILNDPQNQNDVELVMFIMKSMEDKNIKGTDEKINFVDSFKVSDYIKHTVKSYITQDISYSDSEKVSYGIYRFKKCNHQSGSTLNYRSYPDMIKSGSQCFNQPIYDCNP